MLKFAIWNKSKRPGGDEQTADFFAAPPTEPAPIGDAPILMGPPPTSTDEPIILGAPPPGDMQDFVVPDGGVDFIGDVDATGDAPAVLIPEPPMDSGDIMGFAAPEEAVAAAPETAGEEPVEEEKEPPEMSPMAKWNLEWQEILRQRKDDENALKGEHVEAARAELEKFQSEREQRRDQRMAKNRTDEQDKLEAIEADLENDNSWQRSVKLVELQQDTQEAAAEVGRMRDVMILLKNEASRAAVLS